MGGPVPASPPPVLISWISVARSDAEPAEKFVCTILTAALVERHQFAWRPFGLIDCLYSGEVNKRLT